MAKKVAFIFKTARTDIERALLVPALDLYLVFNKHPVTNVDQK